MRNYCYGKKIEYNNYKYIYYNYMASDEPAAKIIKISAETVDIISTEEEQDVLTNKELNIELFKRGLYYQKINDFPNMIKNYEMAINKCNCVKSMLLLGCHYDKINDIPNMLKYFNMAVENKNSNAMYNLALYYDKINDIPNMLKYFNMAVENKNSNAMYYLARYYDKKKDIKLIQYYLMAIENGSVYKSSAMNCIGIFCKKINNIPEMLKYFEMAIEHNNNYAMANLGCYYEEINDIKNMMKYYLMAINAGTHYEKLDSIFNKGNSNKLINFEKMNEIINIINNKQIDINKYKKSIILQIISKFSLKEQYNIRISLNMKTKQHIEIELKLKNFSKDTECCVCLEEIKCIPYNWCNHYLCVDCIIKCNKCPYCRYE
jgi:TPR repeat protein